METKICGVYGCSFHLSKVVCEAQKPETNSAKQDFGTHITEANGTQISFMGKCFIERSNK